MFLHLQPLTRNGGVAQLVEQRTENPCVGGSIPSLTTTQKSTKPGILKNTGFVVYINFWFNKSVPVQSLLHFRL